MFRKEDAETLAVACVAALAIVIIAASIAFGQCPNGQCPESRQTQSNSAMCDNQPTPAWRYERAIGHRSAIVRIYGEDGKGLRSIGSGTLVRWSGRIVVLTARHVIRDAKGIVVWLVTGTKHRARVLRVDTVWDCAVLELEGRPEGIRPVELAYGREAVFGKGARLESCGYGPDGKLASNFGLFIGYRRSTQAMRGPDDWGVISGHARGGDSGGAVFDSRGRLVGVLWGTDGSTVTYVQVGRVHILLGQTFQPARTYPRSHIEGRPDLRLVPVVYPAQCPPVGCPPAGLFSRGGSQHGQPIRGGNTPTPAPMPGQDIGELPFPDQAGDSAGGSWLPWRNGMESKVGDLGRQLQNIDARQREMLDALRQQPSPPVIQPGVPDWKPPKDAAVTPLGVVLCMLGAGVTGVVLFYIVGKQ